MSETRSDDCPAPSEASQAERRAILDAAGQVLDIEGALAVTPENVAARAHFPADLVGAHFQDADELAVGLAAGELSALRQRADMRSHDAEAVSDALVRVQKMGGAFLDAPLPLPLHQKRKTSQKNVGMTPELAGIFDGLVAREAAPRATADTMARFERKLLLIERVLAENLERQRRSASALESVARVEETTRKIGDGMTALGARCEAAVNDLRIAVRNVATRLEVLENLASGEMTDVPPFIAEPVADAERPPVAAMVPQGEREIPCTDDIPPPPFVAAEGISFLEAARRAASAAPDLHGDFGTSASANTRAEFSLPVLLGSVGKPRILAFAGIAISVAAAGVLFLMPQHANRPVVVAAGAPAHTAVTVTPHAANPVERLTALARNGNANAQTLLGMKYLRGAGVAASEAEAREWLQRAADSGNAVAQYRLATLYAKTDPATALHWYQAAALQGNGEAMNNLAVSFASGSGTVRDLGAAMQWFEKAALRGYSVAQFNLAVLLEQSGANAKNLTAAYTWYALAGAAGDAQAQARKNILGGKLAPAARDQADQAVRVFTPSPLNAAANALPTESNLLGG